jgi:hypothetical protein
LTGNEGGILPSLPTISNQVPNSTPVVAESTSPVAASISASSSPTATKKIESMMWGSDASLRGGSFNFYGLDKDGVPTGFTVADRKGAKGKLIVTKTAPVTTDSGVVLNALAMTHSDGPNVLLDQSIMVTPALTTYTVNASVGIKGSWVPVQASDTTYVIERMSNGNYLVTVTILVDSTISSGISVPTGSLGNDLVAAPRSIVTRLVLDSGKTKVLAQAVVVNESKGGAK